MGFTVRISAAGTQTGAGGQTTKTQKTYEGSCSRDGGSFVFLYEEKDGEAERTLTRLRLLKDSLVLERTGALRSRMVFEEGKVHPFSYGTPFGDLDMVLRTDRFRIRKGKKSIHAKVWYTLEMDASERFVCTMQLKMETKEGAFT